MSGLVVQRIRLRWTSRDPAAATVRGRLDREYALPALPADRVVGHEVLLDEATGYQPAHQIRHGESAARDAGLWVQWSDGRAVVDRLPSDASFPVRRVGTRLFSLGPGESARWRANFRFTGCQCAARWWYEEWTVRVAHAPARPELFRDARWVRDRDERVHLYGGPRPGRR
ncbi:hypothetical protein [Micromonospora auratinigra]|uniref:Uncharacterized protein n=1 Tax=Micromonospora auratinigra TaxID=261654 RepID=A0A1A8Z280_9ACTN|nr:hypothetical protein [Micromonospora auratinigra]SBT37867.1 hypothetical protein GA0070611_0358 [Micromonospora auratinigra]